MKPAILAVLGRKGSGKSQVIEHLIGVLKTRGFRIGLIKHLAKPGIEIDQPGKDTARYRRSGAETVILSGRTQWAIFTDRTEEMPLEENLTFFKGYDLVLLEGYFPEDIPKIEVHRSESGSLLSREMNRVLAVVSDNPAVTAELCFTHEQTAELARFVEVWLRTCAFQSNLELPVMHA